MLVRVPFKHVIGLLWEKKQLSKQITHTHTHKYSHRNFKRKKKMPSLLFQPCKYIDFYTGGFGVGEAIGLLADNKHSV